MINMVKRVVLRMFPELESRTHLPMLAKVIAIPDPPRHGELCDDRRPRYAVDLRLLRPDLSIDEEMPLLRDVPVCLAGAGDGRGFALLPQPGAIVEVAFAFGRQSLPFVRGVLPNGLILPTSDGVSMRWQQTPGSYQELSRDGSWTRSTEGDISDFADGRHTTEANAITRQSATSTTDTSRLMHSILAPKIMLGNGDLVAVLSAFMAAVIGALDTLASHTHPDVSKPDQASSLGNYVDAASAAKEDNDAMMP